MKRFNYTHALRAKGIRPLPPAHKLRSSLKIEGEHIVASEPRRAA